MEVRKRRKFREKVQKKQKNEGNCPKENERKEEKGT